MTTIHKYPLEMTARQELKLPIGARILIVQMQHDTPCIWVQVVANRNVESQKTVLHLYGTGYPIPDSQSARYIGTFQEMNGNLVWHLFAETIY